MYLLNKQQLIRHALDPTTSYLTIINFHKKNLQHTSYYFRLGRRLKIVNEPDDCILHELSSRNRTFKLEPNQYVMAESEEIFRLSAKVKAIVGSCSNSLGNGLHVNISPFIDPLYDGHLIIGIKNLLNKPVHLKLFENVGKLSFFDISDTYPIEIEPNSYQGKLFKERANYQNDDGVRYPENEDDSDLYKTKEW